MNTNQNIKMISRIKNAKLASQFKPETRQLLTLGRENGWEFSVLGQAPLPREHFRLGDWMVVPAHQDNSVIPQRALERVQAIYAAGLRPKGFVVVHEAPKLLSAPSEKKPESTPIWDELQNLTPTIKWVGGAIGALTVVTLGVGGLVVAIMAGAALALPTVLVAGAIALDPILIAVTEDNVWIEIDRWLVS